MSELPEWTANVRDICYHFRWRTGATVACLGWTASGQPRHSSRLAKDTPLLTLTADAHPDFVDVDPQWVQLLTDTEVLDSAGVAR